jgi:hypothetical protein
VIPVASAGAPDPGGNPAPAGDAAFPVGDAAPAAAFVLVGEVVLVDGPLPAGAPGAGDDAGPDAAVPAEVTAPAAPPVPAAGGVWDAAATLAARAPGLDDG